MCKRLKVVNQFNLFPSYQRDESKLTGLECIISTVFVALLLLYLRYQLNEHAKTEYQLTTTQTVTTTDVGTDADPYSSILPERKKYEQTLPFYIKIKMNLQQSYDQIFIARNYGRPQNFEEWSQDPYKKEKSSITGCAQAFLVAEDVLQGFDNTGSNQLKHVDKLTLPCDGDRYNATNWGLMGEGDKCEANVYEHIGFAWYVHMYIC